MLALNSLRTANSLIFDISRGAAIQAENSGTRPPVPTLSGDAQGVASVRVGTPEQTSPAESIFTTSMPTRLKINLTERVGKAFGFELDDFPDAGAMAREIDKIVAKMSPGEIMAMEKKLGLDKLGVSLREVLDAMKEPGGDSDLKLDAALREEGGEILEEQEHSARGGSHARFDEIGRYFP
jgi:hypothetical protein